jgi:multiple sugar transport system substrate-binding protein
MTLRGMTWDHPRAYEPLIAYADEHPTPRVRWDRQSLEDFEAHPIDELAVRYDLIVMDHPGLGAAISAGALRALDDLVDVATVSRWRDASVAGTWTSYAMDGRPWAVPIDAATQVSIRRPDLLDAAPTSWSEVVEVSRAYRTALCLGGPHALLALLAMQASALGAVDGNGRTDLLEPDVAAAAIDLLRTVWLQADRAVSAGNPIDVHEAMATRDVAYCPLAYGYASYAKPRASAQALRWTDAPRFGGATAPGARPGSVLGGTGLAVSARSGADHDEVTAFLTAFLDPAIQGDFVPRHGGQPASVAAWDSRAVDEAWGGYYSGTRRTLDAAYIRPRLDGWIGLQDHASALVRNAIVGGRGATAAIGTINERYRGLRATTGGRTETKAGSL